MALIGATIIERIINFLRSKGLNDFGIAGVLGNLFAESGLNSRNLQNTYEKKFGMTDQQYTDAVDNLYLTLDRKIQVAFLHCQ